MSLELELLGVQLDGLGLRMWNFWQKAKFYGNPFKAIDQQEADGFLDTMMKWTPAGRAIRYLQDKFGEGESGRRINQGIKLPDGVPYKADHPSVPKNDNRTLTLNIQSNGVPQATKTYGWTSLDAIANIKTP